MSETIDTIQVTKIHEYGQHDCCKHIGLFITLEPPTSEMRREARATDPYVSPIWKHEYPKLQILTIEDLLKGKRPEIPPTISVFQEAPMEKKSFKSSATNSIHMSMSF
jgi:hypothetical protein